MNLAHYLKIFSVTLFLTLGKLHGIWKPVNTQILHLLPKCCEDCRWLCTKGNSAFDSHMITNRMQVHRVLDNFIDKIARMSKQRT